jgi:hypothetical protein
VLLLACASPPKQQPSPPPSDTPAQSGECGSERCLADITRIIQEHRNESRACFDAGVKRQPKLAEGRIIINFKIEPDGEVSETSQGMQDNQIAEPGIVDCVSELIKKIRFPKSASGKTTRAYHTFEFSRR